MISNSMTPAFTGLKPTAPKFSGTAAQTAVNTFVPKAGRALKALDFAELGATTVNQIKVIYGMVILSRLAAASTRSKNEVRELATLGIPGYLTWLFGTPMLQRVYLRYVAPKEFRDALIQPLAAPAKDANILAKLKYKLPLYRYEIPTSQQIKDRAAQALAKLEKAGHGPETELYTKTAAWFKNGPLKYRYFATGLGWVTTIALLGIGLPLLNIMITRKNVAQAKAAAARAQAPQVPAQAFAPAAPQAFVPQAPAFAASQPQPFAPQPFATQPSALR